jgi:integrative and conjugative element protein (TIGR02256 family)
MSESCSWAFERSLLRFPVSSTALWSEDRQFGVRLAEEVLRHMLQACRQSCPHETGGILVGYYVDTLDCAVVTAATTAPSDSRKGSMWFHRGTYGLQPWLNSPWQRKHTYYLGEWHFHPSAPPSPSQTDAEQMRSIANAPSYHCPEPLLMIIGGDPAAALTVGVYVFPRGKSSLKLLLPTDT